MLADNCEQNIGVGFSKEKLIVFGVSVAIAALLVTLIGLIRYRTVSKTCMKSVILTFALTFIIILVVAVKSYYTDD